MCTPLDFEDHQTGRTGRDVGISPRQVNVPRVCKGQSRDRLRMGEVSDIQHLDSFGVARVRIAKLNLNGSWMVQERLAEHRCNFRVLWVFERYHDQTSVARDISIRPGDRDPPGSIQDSVGIKGQLAAQEVVERVPVQ